MIRTRAVPAGRILRAGVLFLAMSCPALAFAHKGEAHDTVGTPAAVVPDFTPPAVGSYVLHRIMPAPEGKVLDTDGKGRPLSAFTRDRITLLGFIYTTCTDPEGCPLAYRVFSDLREAVTATPALRDKVRMVSLSFDPARDSPSVMRQYAGSYAQEKPGAPPWYFLTTGSARELLPLVEGFGQDVRITWDRTGRKPKRELSHVLKVFLIDPAGDIREIYTSTFLYPQLVLNDIETLLREQATPEAAAH